jgi:hypothetical protein
MGRPDCIWRQSATEALESRSRPFRIQYVSWHSTAVGGRRARGAVRLGPARKRPCGPACGCSARPTAIRPCPSCKIGLIRNAHEGNPLADALGDHIRQSLDNLASGRVGAPMAEAAE